MLRKPQEEDAKQLGNRVTLPEEPGIRALAGFKELLALAEASKGSQFELSWLGKVPGQRFVLDIQWDVKQKAPFWTLYEESNGKSKRLWNEPLTIANVDMCYDILVMTCGGVEAGTKNLAEILKAQPAQMDWSKSSVDAPSKTATEQKNDNKNSSSATNSSVANAAVESQNIANQANDANFPGTTMNPVNPMNPGQGFPMPAYNAALPNMPMPIPVYPPPGMPMPGMPANAWQYGLPMAMYNQPNMPMPGMPMQNMPAQGLASLPIDNTLVSKQADNSLVDLIVKAELLSEKTLAAAMKIQELIMNQELTWERGIKILKEQYSQGDKIDTYINMSASTSANTKTTEKSKATAYNEDNKVAFALLQQAGLISQNDIKTAENVTKKHGGDIASVLKAAQKLDDKTFEAAKICSSLQKDQLMKVEQSVILVNYCSRSRVSFDEALSELNWPDPRKQPLANS